MKRLRWIALIGLMFPLLTAWSEEVYCRYKDGHGVFYGRVEKDTIHQLSEAPWLGGRETGTKVGISKVKLLNPSEPTKIIGMSGTYKENWTGGKKPYNTVRWFLKPPTSAASPGEDIILPASLDTLMAESELVVVIGKKVKNASVEEAKDAIFGYTVGNDLVGEATSYHRIQGEPLDQEETLLPFALKQGDGFSPYGPYIYRGVDWHNRERELRIINSKTNKELTYRHSTSNLVYTPEKMISDLSKVFTLDPGDVIFTATTKALPAQAGDIMEIRIEGLGAIVNKVVPCPVR